MKDRRAPVDPSTPPASASAPTPTAALDPVGRGLDELRRAMEDLEPSVRDWSLNYLKNHANRYRSDLALIKEFHPGGEILEVGSAPFHMTYLMKAAGLDVVGVDLAPERAAAFVERHGLDVRQADIEREDLLFGEERFPMAVLNEVFEHLRINPLDTLERIHRVLQPGGVFLLTTPNLYWIRNIWSFARGRGVGNPAGEYGKLRTIGHMGHVREYAASEVAAFLRRTGFEVKEVRYRWFARSRSGRRLAARALYAAAPFLRPYMAIVCEKRARWQTPQNQVGPPAGPSRAS